MSTQSKIQTFLAGKRFAVVGASADRGKYGNKVLRCYMQNNIEAVPINPTATNVEGLTAYADLAAAPGTFDGVSIITPPPITERVVDDALRLGIKNIWIQPGAESDSAIAAAEAVGANVIAHGPCVLVSLRYHDED
jgi:predicted CoA-binding protein